jgi:hypothetical protein
MAASSPLPKSIRIRNAAWWSGSSFAMGYGEKKSAWVSGCNPAGLSAFVDRLFSGLEFSAGSFSDLLFGPNYFPLGARG